MVRFVALVALILMAGGALCAEETVCLKSGFCIKAQSHSRSRQDLVFSVGSGTIQVAASDVISIEAAPAAPAPIGPSAPKASSLAQESANAILADAAKAEGLEAEFVRSVAAVESSLREKALSSKGAVGLMQLMPKTAKDLGVDPTNAGQNANGGAKYLRALLIRYNYNSALALAAYNAGPGAVAKFGGVPPYKETLDYINRVTHEYDRLRRQAARPKGPAPVCVSESPSPETGSRSVPRADCGE